MLYTIKNFSQRLSWHLIRNSEKIITRLQSTTSTKSKTQKNLPKKISTAKIAITENSKKNKPFEKICAALNKPHNEENSKKKKSSEKINTAPIKPAKSSEELICRNLKCKAERNDQDECKDTEFIENQKWHRVFGEWKCTNCQTHWKSGHVWIHLEKFNYQTNASKLIKTQDYFRQSCKNHKCNSNTSILIWWKHLSKSKDLIRRLPHRADLCAKCKKGIFCSFEPSYYS
ncbi:hypothetical protein C2G38_1534777 [Gigaspora rosea]|uniref:3CxxC-type domain-containing protein n=1 Tax=Gigaspora rosea TaxID=44941 RepID=A0A397WAB1_9GLOM|nr:hypothetical protein C2G38_1534777 [Gigaspora rosea]